MKPKVSVCMIVFNHEMFVKKAIDGVLMQETNFEVELVISNDASTDSSNEIISQTIESSKVIRIKQFNHTVNLGMMANFIFALQQCEGEYIAICEGDDYWTDPLKLQKQVDALEKNPDCSICFTYCSKLQLNGEILPPTPKNVSTKTRFEDLLKGNYISTLTTVFVSENNLELPAWFKTLSIGDWPLYLWILRNDGKAYFLEEDTAMYRANIGVSSAIRRNPILDLNIMKDILVLMSTDLNFKKHKPVILKTLYDQETKIMSFYMKRKKYALGSSKLVTLCFRKPSVKLLRLFLYSFKESFK